MKPLERINTLLGEFETEEFTALDQGSPIYVGIHSKTHWYTVRSLEALQKYRASLDAVYRMRSNLPDTISEKKFEKEFQNYLRTLLHEERPTTEEELKAFLNHLEEAPITNYHVLKPIVGIRLGGQNEPKYGPIRIIDTERRKDIDFVKSITNNVKEDVVWGPHKYRYYALTEVRAREPDRAYELAEDIMRQFQESLIFALGRPTRDDEYIGIINISLPLTRTGIIISDAPQITSKFENKLIVNPLEIDADYFFDTEIGHGHLWSLLQAGADSKMQQKTALAISWISAGHSEEHPGLALLKYTIALESLYSNLDKGSMITPGITASIAEGVALLLGANFEDRQTLERRIKYLYGKRSALTHGGGSNVRIADKAECAALATRSVRCFLSNPDLRILQSPEQFLNHLKKLKYS